MSRHPDFPHVIVQAATLLQYARYAAETYFQSREPTGSSYTDIHTMRDWENPVSETRGLVAQWLVHRLAFPPRER